MNNVKKSAIPLGKSLKRKPGPVPIPDKAVISICMTFEDKTRIEELARGEGRTCSNYLRRFIQKNLLSASPPEQ